MGKNTPGKDGFWGMAERSFLQRLEYLYQDLYLGGGFDFTDESKTVLLKMVSFVQSGVYVKTGEQGFIADIHLEVYTR